MTSSKDVPADGSAEVYPLVEGYADTGVSPFKVASSVTLLREGDVRVIVDPGFVPDRRALLDRLEQLGESADGITDVVFSHHHPDHTVNAALFPYARLHDYWAIYQDDTWASRPAEGFALSPSISLLETPGHTPQDITTIARTADDVVALTHLWWMAAGPAVDPFSDDQPAIAAGRSRILGVATLIIPGHGPAFRPDEATPR